MQYYWQGVCFSGFFFFFSLSIFSVIFVEMSAKMRSLDREVRGLRMEKEDIERVSVDFICFVFFFPNQNSVFEQSAICLFFCFYCNTDSVHSQ